MDSRNAGVVVIVSDRALSVRSPMLISFRSAHLPPFIKTISRNQTPFRPYGFSERRSSCHSLRPGIERSKPDAHILQIGPSPAIHKNYQPESNTVSSVWILGTPE